MDILRQNNERFCVTNVYRIVAFSGMFMMWSSVSSLGFCCCGEQDLNGEAAVSSSIKCFIDGSSFSSMQSLEPSLVPENPQIKLIFLHCLFIIFIFVQNWDDSVIYNNLKIILIISTIFVIIINFISNYIIPFTCTITHQDKDSNFPKWNTSFSLLEYNNDGVQNTFMWIYEFSCNKPI